MAKKVGKVKKWLMTLKSLPGRIGKFFVDKFVALLSTLGQVGKSFAGTSAVLLLVIAFSGDVIYELAFFSGYPYPWNSIYAFSVLSSAVIVSFIFWKILIGIWIMLTGAWKIFKTIKNTVVSRPFTVLSVIVFAIAIALAVYMIDKLDFHMIAKLNFHEVLASIYATLTFIVIIGTLVICGLISCQFKNTNNPNEPATNIPNESTTNTNIMVALNPNKSTTDIMVALFGVLISGVVLAGAIGNLGLVKDIHEIVSSVTDIKVKEQVGTEIGKVTNDIKNNTVDAAEAAKEAAEAAKEAAEAAKEAAEAAETTTAIKDVAKAAKEAAEAAKEAAKAAIDAVAAQTTVTVQMMATAAGVAEDVAATAVQATTEAAETVTEAAIKAAETAAAVVNAVDAAAKATRAAETAIDAATKAVSVIEAVTEEENVKEEKLEKAEQAQITVAISEVKENTQKEIAEQKQQIDTKSLEKKLKDSIVLPDNSTVLENLSALSANTNTHEITRLSTEVKQITITTASTHQDLLSVIIQYEKIANTLDSLAPATGDTEYRKVEKQFYELIINLITKATHDISSGILSFLFGNDTLEVLQLKLLAAKMNLGATEIQLTNYVDAKEHLEYVIDETTSKCGGLLYAELNLLSQVLLIDNIIKEENKQIDAHKAITKCAGKADVLQLDDENLLFIVAISYKNLADYEQQNDTQKLEYLRKARDYFDKSDTALGIIAKLDIEDKIRKIEYNS